MGNLNDLAKRLEAKAANVGEVNSERAVAVALAMVGELAYHTPVDTSQALSNWDVTLDSPATGKHGPHFRGAGGSTLRQSAAETLAIAKRILAGKKPGQRIYITNNQPYIRKLNDGTHSKQPGGFLERALLVGRRVRQNFKPRKRT
jgi:hypothetical protein